MKAGKIINLPDKIYLNFFDEHLMDYEEIDFHTLHEVTWTADEPAVLVSEKYVRASEVKVAIKQILIDAIKKERGEAFSAQIGAKNSGDAVAMYHNQDAVKAFDRCLELIDGIL